MWETRPDKAEQRKRRKWKSSEVLFSHSDTLVSGQYLPRGSMQFGQVLKCKKIDLGMFNKGTFHLFNKLQSTVYDVLSTRTGQSHKSWSSRRAGIPGSRSSALISKKGIWRVCICKGEGREGKKRGDRSQNLDIAHERRKQHLDQNKAARPAACEFAAKQKHSSFNPGEHEGPRNIP